MANERYIAGSDSDSYTPSNWITGETKITTTTVTIQSGAGVVAAKSLLGIVTANGQAVPSLAAAGDGSQVPRYILVDEIDATSGPVEAAAYATGCFNPDLVQFGTGHTASSVKEELRDRGILLKQLV